ncbi:gamma subclass chorismate mutase AroQ [Nocardia panacis]|uniref:chorismate mutase n=1 Tax=Nocardia panacis TaxID=2340916 RepID=A0A3A4JZV0_9NOCA|nr:gamma subclass chorismate mutase AroQ [Nocardia panacis]RJO77045.1 gamma subclass chorismate mutase AroQ [Nocardia panacis]
MRVLLASVAAALLASVVGSAAVGSAGLARAEASGSLDRLVGLVADRLDTADSVAAAKWASAGADAAVDDPAREAQVYAAMTRLGAASDLPENWVGQVFFGQIEASKTVQRGLLLRWRFDPARAPAAPPDLSAVRPRIDGLNAEIVAELAAHRAELAAPDCAQRLARSVFEAFASRPGDALHRVALVRATVVLCAG